MANANVLERPGAHKRRWQDESNRCEVGRILDDLDSETSNRVRYIGFVARGRKAMLAELHALGYGELREAQVQRHLTDPTRSSVCCACVRPYPAPSRPVDMLGEPVVETRAPKPKRPSCAVKRILLALNPEAAAVLHRQLMDRDRDRPGFVALEALADKVTSWRLTDDWGRISVSYGPFYAHAARKCSCFTAPRTVDDEQETRT